LRPVLISHISLTNGGLFAAFPLGIFAASLLRLRAWGSRGYLLIW
jgi:hypothetical protein